MQQDFVVIHYVFINARRLQFFCYSLCRIIIFLFIFFDCSLVCLGVLLALALASRKGNPFINVRDDAESSVDVDPRKDVSVFGTLKGGALDISLGLDIGYFFVQGTPMVGSLDGSAHVGLLEDPSIAIDGVYRVTNSIVDMDL